MKDSKKTMSLAYELFRRVHDGDFEYVYRGSFTHNITKKILALAETNLQKTVDMSSIQKRIYFIMMEGLQNITKHQYKLTDKMLENSGIFAVQKKHDQYFVTTGNLIRRVHIDPMKEQLREINSLDRDQLKKLHKQILRTGQLTDKGGAGLGLIEIARKSGNKLLFDFENINDEFAYFYFQTEIPTTKSEQKAPEVIEFEKNSMHDIRTLHERLNNENILINFDGYFDQTNVLNLLSIIKSQMDKTATAKRVYHIMVELLQNISKHAERGEMQIDENPGIFYLSEADNKFIMTAGNFIQRDHVHEFTKKLDFINDMNNDELHHYYDQILLDYGNVSGKKTGLGLVDIRLKSDNKLNYSTYNINDKTTFLTIQTSVKLK